MLHTYYQTQILRLFSWSNSLYLLCCPLWNICVTNDHGYVPFVVSTSRSFPHSWLITGVVTRLRRRVPLVDQELLTLSERLSSPPVFSEVRVTRTLVLCVCFVDRCLSFCTFSFGHCVVCSSIYGFWLPLQTLLIVILWNCVMSITVNNNCNCNHGNYREENCNCNHDNYREQNCNCNHDNYREQNCNCNHDIDKSVYI